MFSKTNYIAKKSGSSDNNADRRDAHRIDCRCLAVCTAHTRSSTTAMRAKQRQQKKRHSRGGGKAGVFCRQHRCVRVVKGVRSNKKTDPRSHATVVERWLLNPSQGGRCCHRSTYPFRLDGLHAGLSDFQADF